MKIPAIKLESITKKILCSLGVSSVNAEIVAEHLISASLRGVDTHGFFKLIDLVESLRKGEIIPDANPKVLTETQNTALVSGSWTFGHVGTKYAAEVAISKAKKENISLVSLVETDHTGRLGYYVEMAAKEGLISMMWNGGAAEEIPVTIPFGGAKPVLSTHPLAFGAPLADNQILMIDFATTTIPGMKAKLARKEGKQVPPNSLVDKDGNPTTDPFCILDGGSFVPFGGHKGYAIMVAVEYLGRILSGSDTYAGEYGGPYHRTQGLTMIAFKADLFRLMEDYTKSAQEMAERIRSIPPAKGFKKVYMPGDIEAETYEIRSKEGIPVSDEVWSEIEKIAKSLDINIEIGEYVHES